MTLRPAARAAERWIRQHAEHRDSDGRGICLSNRQLHHPDWVRLRDALTAELWPTPAPQQLDLFGGTS